MKNQLEAVRSLASLETQERYIMHGTSDEYLLPQELISDAIMFVADVEAGRRGSKLSGFQHEAIRDFGRILNAHGHIADAGLSKAELIDNPAWIAVRDAAQRLLANLEGCQDSS